MKILLPLCLAASTVMAAGNLWPELWETPWNEEFDEEHGVSWDKPKMVAIEAVINSLPVKDTYKVDPNLKDYEQPI